MKKNSQLYKIKEHLKWNKTITSWEAIQKYRITRLASIIHILRTEYQMNINSISKSKNGKNWVEYKYHQESGGQYSIF